MERLISEYKIYKVRTKEVGQGRRGVSSLAQLLFKYAIK